MSQNLARGSPAQEKRKDRARNPRSGNPRSHPISPRISTTLSDRIAGCKSFCLFLSLYYSFNYASNPVFLSFQDVSIRPVANLFQSKGRWYLCVFSFIYFASRVLFYTVNSLH